MIDIDATGIQTNWVYAGYNFMQLYEEGIKEILSLPFYWKELGKEQIIALIGMIIFVSFTKLLDYIT